MLVISAGGGGRERLNTVPTAPGPPLKAVPYSEFPNRNTGATGKAPSLLVPFPATAAKLWSVLNWDPLRSNEKTVPAAPAPPADAVPYRTLPASANAAQGEAPS